MIKMNFFNRFLNLIRDNYQEKSHIANKLYNIAMSKCKRIDKTYFDLRFKFMSEDQIEELSKIDNVKIGYHTRDHDIISLKNVKEFNDELDKDFEFINKYNVIDFAFSNFFADKRNKC